MTKKALWLAAKAAESHRLRGLVDPPGAPVTPVISLHNLWTLEVLPVRGSEMPSPTLLSTFLRCHFTERRTVMAPALLPAVLAAAHHFHVQDVLIVSGFRAPKYNLFLHKKGHQVARDSQHLLGHAIDFRLPSIDVWTLREYVRSLHLGGVGYYPISRFVHMDIGPVRFWQAD